MLSRMCPPPALGPVLHVLDWADLEHALARRTPVARAALAFSAANVLAYVLWAGASDAAVAAVARTWGADLNVFAGEWWRALTSAFVHVNPWHLCVNVGLLALFGARVERAYGSAAFALVYVASAVAASLAGVWFRPDAVCVGASGALFGSIGALLPYYVLGGRMHGLPARRLDATYLSVILVGSLLAGLAVPRTGNGAHLGGLLGGVLVGALLGGGQLWRRTPALAGEV
jgi:rhomboid protease GluP